MLSGLVASPTIDLSNSARLRSRAPSRLPVTNASANTAHEPQASSSTALTRTAVSLEYASLRHAGHCPLGMYIIPSPDNLLVWDAIFFVHQGGIWFLNWRRTILRYMWFRVLHRLYPQIPSHIPTELS